eukprot:g7985.t1
MEQQLVQSQLVSAQSTHDIAKLDHYAVINRFVDERHKISTSSSTEEIESAYRHASQRVHPDARGGSGDRDAFLRVNEACTVLTATDVDVEAGRAPCSREDYDKGRVLKESYFYFKWHGFSMRRPPFSLSVNRDKLRVMWEICEKNKDFVITSAGMVALGGVAIACVGGAGMVLPTLVGNALLGGGAMGLFKATDGCYSSSRERLTHEEFMRSVCGGMLAGVVTGTMGLGMHYAGFGLSAGGLNAVTGMIATGAVGGAAYTAAHLEGERKLPQLWVDDPELLMQVLGKAAIKGAVLGAVLGAVMPEPFARFAADPGLVKAAIDTAIVKDAGMSLLAETEILASGRFVEFEGQPASEPHASYMGTYSQVAGKEMNGRGVWRSDTHADCFMYYATSNDWFVGRGEDMRKGRPSGWWRVTGTAAQTPNLIAGRWQVVVGGVFVNARAAVKVRRLTKVQWLEAARRRATDADAAMYEAQAAGTIVMEGQPMGETNAECMGAYELVSGEQVNGRGVWRSDTNAGCFMYYTNSNAWCVGSDEDMQKGRQRGWWKVTSAARTPDLIADQERWQVPEDGEFIDAHAAVRVRRQ